MTKIAAMRVYVKTLYKSSSPESKGQCPWGLVCSIGDMGPINAYTSHDFLFGIGNKTQGENEALFSQVQKFIVNSGRFT